MQDREERYDWSPDQLREGSARWSAVSRSPAPKASLVGGVFLGGISRCLACGGGHFTIAPYGPLRPQQAASSRLRRVGVSLRSGLHGVEHGSGITGALLTGQASQAGTVLGLRGTVVNPSRPSVLAFSSIASKVSGSTPRAMCGGGTEGLQTLRWRKADSNSRSHLTGQCQKRDGSPYRVRPRRALARLLQLEEQPAAAL